MKGLQLHYGGATTVAVAGLTQLGEHTAAFQGRRVGAGMRGISQPFPPLLFSHRD